MCKHGKKYSSTCSSLLYGALIKQLSAAGMMLLSHDLPLFSKSIDDIQRKVAAFKNPEWLVDGIREHKCTLDDFKEAIQKPASALELRDYFKTGGPAEETPISEI
jgi:hypothetical protein